MSLPPALMQRLAQRGLLQKQKQSEAENSVVENEEVIAEDYDEMEAEMHTGPEDFHSPRKRTEENFWLERMKARMGTFSTLAGHKGCPNKYNIWHKCTLFCVNHWAEGKPEPSREYLRRFKRMLRKYPLPKGWAEVYDPGCGSYYFYNAADGLVSWLPPTHPKSYVSKSAAMYRKQLEEADGKGDSDGEQSENDERVAEEGSAAHQREINDIINASLSKHDLPALQDTVSGGSTFNMPPPPQRKQKSRDLERTISRQRRDRDKDRSRRYRRDDSDTVDPMDPSAYSDTPRGKWSDGLHVEERKKSASKEDSIKERERGSSGRERDRRDEHSDDEDD